MSNERPAPCGCSCSSRRSSSTTVGRDWDPNSRSALGHTHPYVECIRASTVGTRCSAPDGEISHPHVHSLDHCTVPRGSVCSDSFDIAPNMDCPALPLRRVGDSKASEHASLASQATKHGISRSDSGYPSFYPASLTNLHRHFFLQSFSPPLSAELLASWLSIRPNCLLCFCLHNCRREKQPLA